MKIGNRLSWLLMAGTLTGSFLTFSGPSALAADRPLPPITAPGAIVLDRDTGAVLGATNPDTRRAIASTTKMMTALVVMDRNSSLDTLVGPTSSNAANWGGTTMGLHTGDRVSIRDLLYGMLLPSGNDAAIALAEATSGTVDNFVSLMNQKAQALGLTNTHFRHPAGWEQFASQCEPQYAGQVSCGHYSTPRDLAKLAGVLLQNPTLAQVVRTANWTPTAWYDAYGNRRSNVQSNSNLLLSSMPYAGANGVKTGQSPVALWCMVGSAARSNRNVISVVLGSAMPGADNSQWMTVGSEGDKARHYDIIQLLDFGYARVLGAPGFANGSFEQGFAGWTATGNLDLTSPASSGAYAVRFNAGQRPPCGMVSQSFATAAGQSCTLRFAYGVFSAVSSKEQRLRVKVIGNSLLLDTTISQSAFSNAVQYTSRSYSFVTDSPVTTVSFADVSAITDSVDSYVDNVQISAGSTASPTPTPAPRVTQLIANGNFETAPTRVRGAIPGWTVGGPGHVAAQNEGYTSASNSASFSEGGDFTGDAISQRFSTVAGKVYTLTFQAGVFGVHGGNPQQLRVQVKGNTTRLDQIVTPPEAGTYTPSSVKFQRYSFNFTADSSSPTLVFTEIGTGNATADVQLDDVSVVAASP